jgi:glycosyltransferase involved in cell wall biosynthesis
MILEILFIIFCISSFVAILLNILSLFKLAKYKTKEHILDIEDKPVSIVVCAHNEIENLKVLLPKLLAQAYVDFEVIIVDDRSTDGSYEYLLEEQSKHANMKMVRVEWTPDHVNEKKYALTLGIKGAKNDLLVFTDADCEPISYNWLKKMVSQFNGKTDFVLGFSYYREHPGFLNKFIRHETLQTALLYVTMALLGLPYMGVGRNIGYKRSFFLSKKGFNKILKVTGGDDDLFVNRYSTSKNTTVVLDPESVILSEPKNSLGEFITQKIRHISVSKLYKFKHKLLIGVISISKILFWITGLSLIIPTYNIYWTAGLFSIQLLLLLWVYDRFTKVLKVKYEIWSLWFMDFVYISYLILFSLRAFTARRIKWN